MAERRTYSRVGSGKMVYSKRADYVGQAGTAFWPCRQHRLNRNKEDEFFLTYPKHTTDLWKFNTRIRWGKGAA